ncbi:efflux RND transporter periplasmic adaptor subunit [Rubinisphaera italica]|uniref:Cation efflux system protein CusB n=1 Tax=Rubinisphaera italica TaxID=2527969 RepID=A0A5C5XJU6_9PLAN|nr:efflux RND transporter periplasmic adaptor subunit [Rubinisphaera italica]TWT62395.1 Cation efflux system protein CusB precursor [Rubinisphaera italica]
MQLKLIHQLFIVSQRNLLLRIRFSPSEIATATLALLFILTASQAKAQFGPSPVVVSPVVKEQVSVGQNFVGTVRPIKTAAVGSAVNGRVSEFPINEGDYIEAGSPLAQLLTETIRLEHEAAVHEQDLREQELKELENGSRPEEISRAKAALAAAKAAKDYNEKKRQRAEDLYGRGAINSDEIQLILSDYIQAEQMFVQMTEAYDLVVQGPRKEQIAQARAQVAIRKAIANRLADQLKKHTIRTPFNGFVSAEHTEVGQWVSQGELVAEVIELDYVDVETYVPEQYIAYIHKGQQVTVEIPALQDHLFTGTVEMVIPQADTRSRTFPVKVRLKNTIEFAEPSEEKSETISIKADPLIKSGMQARVHLPTGNKQEALLLPKDALVLGGPQRIVYVVVPGQEKEPATVKPVPVIVGVANGDHIVVRGDLQEGDQVVIRGNERLRPGQQVIPQLEKSKPQVKKSKEGGELAAPPAPK